MNDRSNEESAVDLLPEPARRGRRWAWVAAWIVATVLLVICFRVVGLERLLAIASRLRPGWVALSVLANLGIQVSAALLWRLLLPPGFRVPYGRLFGVMTVGSLLMNTAPLLVGHASLAVMLSRTRGVGNAAALSVLALDQLVEGMSKVLVVALALSLAPVPGWMRTGGIVLGGVILSALTALVTIARRHDALATWAASRHRLTKAIAAWARHLETLRTPRRFAMAWGASLGMKCFELLGIVAAQHALGVSLPLGSSVLVLAAVGLGTMLPLTPGNIGTYETAALLAYGWLGLSPQEALAVALVQHLSYLIAGTVPGYLGVVVIARKRA